MKINILYLRMIALVFLVALLSLQIFDLTTWEPQESKAILVESIEIEEHEINKELSGDLYISFDFSNILNNWCGGKTGCELIPVQSGLNEKVYVGPPTFCKNDCNLEVIPALVDTKKIRIEFRKINQSGDIVKLAHSQELSLEI